MNRKIKLGIDKFTLGKFKIVLRPDNKIIIISSLWNYHLTLHPGHNSDMVDLHKTYNNPAMHKLKHETLYLIPRSDIVAFLTSLFPSIPDLLRIMLPVHIDWLAKKNYVAYRLPMESELDSYTQIAISDLNTENEISSNELLHYQDYAREILKMSNSSYLLFSPKNRLCGMLFSKRNPNGEVYLRLIKTRDLNRWMSVLHESVIHKVLAFIEKYKV